VHLQFSVPVAAVLEPKGLELVVAGRQEDSIGLNMTPSVARGVLGAIDADE
jgi:hypothetical protein